MKNRVQQAIIVLKTTNPKLAATLKVGIYGLKKEIEIQQASG